MTTLNALLTEILEDYANGYTYFEYPLTYGKYKGELILQGECLVVHLEDTENSIEDNTIGLLIESTDLKTFESSSIAESAEKLEKWINSNIYYNMQ
jgi:hypothetical protein